MAERFASWQGVIVGHPKTTLIADNTAGLAPAAPFIDALILYPNPSRGAFQIKGIDKKGVFFITFYENGASIGMKKVVVE